MPRFAVKAVFKGNSCFTACGTQCYILIGPIFRIACDGEIGEYFVDLCDIHLLSCDIACLVGGFEIDSSVFFDSDAAVCMPEGVVKAVFDDGIAFIACSIEHHIGVGPIFRIACDGEIGEYFVDLCDIHLLSCDIACLVGGFEIDSSVFFDSDAAVCMPEGVVKAVFDDGIAFIACSIEHHIGVGPIFRIAADGEIGECFVDFVDIHLLSGDITGFVGGFEMECPVLFDGDAAACVPYFPIKAVFKGNAFFTACGVQSHIFVGPIFRIACDGEIGKNFVDFCDIHLLSGDIARLVGGFEVNISVFSDDHGGTLFPPGAVEAVFDEGIIFIACGSECHILIGPIFRITCDGETGEDLVDFVDIHTLSGDITGFVGGSEVDGFIFFHNDF